MRQVFPISFKPGYTTIETRHLRVFVAVYKALSFTKAATELYTSQPTVSEHIQNLEARLNCKLFDRLGRTIMPTVEAELLYPRARAILEDLDRLADELSATGNIVAGELIIGASTIPGAYILPQLAASFKEQFPDISFEIRIGDSALIVDKVAANDIFMGVVGVKISSPKLTYYPFVEDELILAAAATNPIADSIRIKDLGKLPFIVREKGSGTRKSTETLLGQHDLALNKFNICATLGSSAAVKEAVKANLGVSILSRQAVRDEISSGQVRNIQVEGMRLKRKFYIVVASRRTLPVHYNQFFQFIQSI